MGEPADQFERVRREPDVVDHLTNHLPELYAQVNGERSSTVVRSGHDDDTVTGTEGRWPPRVPD